MKTTPKPEHYALAALFVTKYHTDSALTVTEIGQLIADHETQAVAKWVNLNAEQMKAALSEAEERAKLEANNRILHHGMRLILAKLEPISKTDTELEIALIVANALHTITP